MEYKKEFNKKRTKVTIIVTEGRGIWGPVGVLEKGETFESIGVRELYEKTFEVIKKEEIYNWIEKGKPVNLANKYVEGFSLYEYRKNNKMEFSKKVTIKDFYAQDAFFDGGADFSSAIFEGKGWVNFFYAVFGDGKVSFSHARFRDKEVHFDFTIFGKGEVSFSKAHFGDGKVSFWGANFGDGDVNFANAHFGDGDVDFANANFGDGKVSFCSVTFGKGNTFFSEANFGDGDVDFGGAVFGDGKVTFVRSHFGDGKVSFWGANFGDGGVFFTQLESQGDWDLGFAQANVIDFSHLRMNGTIDFTRTKMKQLKLVDIQLTGKIFVGLKELGLGRELKQQKDVINIQDDTYHGEKRDQFRLLKENFHSLGQYDAEDRAYYWFKYHEIRDEAKIGQTDNWIDWLRKKMVYGFKRVVFELMGKYGTAPRNVAVSMIVVVALFSVLYLPCGSLKKFGLPTDLPNWSVRIINSIYHSVITFLTIGYGSNFIHQTIWGRVLSGFEGFLGLFLMSYFTVSFARKVLR